MDTDVESTQSRQKKGQMKSIFLSDSDKEAIVEFVKQHEKLYDKTNDRFKKKQKKERLWEQLAATRNSPYQHCEEVVRDSTYQIWQVHSDEVRTICSEEHRMTDLAEGQFQFSTRSHQKEGSFQVFCIQVTTETFCSHSLSFSSRYIKRHRI